LIAFAFVFQVIRFDLLQASSLNLSRQIGKDASLATLDLESEAGEMIGVDAADSNDTLILNFLMDENFGVIGKAMMLAKYILGGVFMLYMILYTISLLTSQGSDDGVSKFKNEVLYTFVGFLIFGIAEPFATAFSYDQTGGDLLTSPKEMLESANVVGYSLRTVAHFIQYVVSGIALIFMGISAFKMLTAGENEEDISQARKNILWAAVGLILMTSIRVIVDQAIVQTEDGGIAPIIFAEERYEMLTLEQQADVMALSSRLNIRTEVMTHIKYFQTFVAAAAVFMLFLAGFKMVAADGNDEIISQQKKMIPWVFAGLGTILISEVFVSIFMPEDEVTKNIAGQSYDTIEITTPGIDQITSFSAQVGGVTNFVLTFSGAVAVLALVVGALYLTTAVANPEQAEKAKQIILGAVLGLVITISAYAVVNTILSGTLG